MHLLAWGANWPFRCWGIISDDHPITSITVKIRLCHKVSITFSNGWLVWYPPFDTTHIQAGLSHRKFGYMYIFLVFSKQNWQRKERGDGSHSINTTMEERWSVKFSIFWVFCFLDFEILHVSCLTRSYCMGKVWKSWWRNIGRENEAVILF